MVKLRKVSFLIVLIAVVFTKGVYAQETIKSASEYDYPPFSIVTEKGEADGFSVELLRASLKAVGLDVEFYVGPWAKIKQDLTQGKIQVLPLVGRTPEREKLYDFSVPYLTKYGAIFVRVDEASINTLKDLADKEVLVMKGDNAEEFLVRENVSKHIITTESFEDAFKMLSEGKHDAIVTQQTVGTQLIERLGITNVIYKSRIGTYKQDWTFAVKEGDKELLAKINDGLSKIIINGTFDRIHDKWFKRPNVDGKIKIKLTSKEKIFEEKVIELIAIGIAKEIDDYLEKNPQKTIEDLQNDEYFKAIATQQVGETGYTAVVDSQSGYFYFHPREQFVGANLAGFEEDFNDLWKILEATRGEQCTESSGYYGWKEVGGEVTKKYLNTACIKNATADGKNLFIVASTYLTEIEGTKYLKKYDVIKTTFAEESIQQKAEDVARQVEIYLNAYPDKTLKDLQNDPEFQKIAIQPVGETGYTVMSDYNKLVVLFHPNKKIVGLEIESMSRDYPVMWELLKQARGGHDISGIYKFPDLNGVIKDKYLYIKIPKVKTADGVGMWVAATTYLDEYEEIVAAKEPAQRISMFWFFWALILVILVLFILGKLNIIKLEKNAIMFFLSIALLSIIGLFVFNAYSISKKMKQTAIENYYDILRATASNKHVNIEQHISHIKSSFKTIKSRKIISNEDLRKIVNFGEDFIEVFITDSNGKITHSSDLSNIGLSRSEDIYFKNATKDIYIKPLYHSSTVGKLLFTISVPYKEGVLIARMNLNHIHQIISKKEGLGESGENLLAYRNKNGNAVFFTERRFTAEAEARDVIPKEDINIPITQALLGNEKEFSNYVDYRNVSVFAVTKYIEEIDAGLVVKIDQKEVFESVSGNIKQIWYSATVIIFSIIIICIIFYFVLTYSLKREIKNKTKALKQEIETRKHAEEVLHMSKDYLRNIINAIGDPVFVKDDESRFILANDSMCEILGIERENIIGKTLGESLPDNQMKHFLKIDKLVFESGQDNSCEEILTGRDGNILTVVTKKTRYVDEQGNRFIVGTIRDITERKQAEAEKNKLESRLQQAQKMESIGILAGGIAHDFNNILYPIIGFTELSIQDLPKTHQVQENLQDILDGAKRARDLVKQILQFSRQEKQTLQPTILQPVVEEVVKLLRTTIPANIDIQCHLYNGEDYVLCDSTEIHEIVMNLCTNAYHSMEENGGTIIVGLNKQIPSPDLNLPSGEYICLSVSDNGVGIPKDIIDKIFEPYLTTKEIGKGSGLGLSVVHGIVSNYKGNIAVESSPGKGSDFIVFLPITTQSRIVKQTLIKDKSLGGTENILFVDDEASIIKLATRILERMGYTITGKTSCIEALELFTQKPDGFDLVITDMAMPIMTGTEFAKKILKIQPDIPIIICSGFSENVDSKIAKSIGIKEYVKKPILLDDLTSKIRKVLDQSSKG